MSSSFLFAVGYEEISVRADAAAQIIELCMRYGYLCRRARFEGEYYLFRCTLTTARSLKKSCRDEGIAFEVRKRSGIPALLYRYRYRYGAAIGAALFFFIVFFSGSVIWDVRIEGNRRLEEEEVIAALAECGLSVGDFKRDIDTSLIENILMIKSDDISWISINLIGSVAEVEIRERDIAPEEEAWDAANIVAAEDGEIVLFEAVRGNILLKIGDRVRAGELIVSGIYDGSGALRYTNAKGKVFAEVEEEILVEVPLEYDKKVYTGRVYTEKSLVFFKKEIKIYSNCRNLTSSCDKIDTVEYLDVLSQGELPVGVRTVRYFEYTNETQKRDTQEAQRLAEYKLSAILGARAADSELLGVKRESFVTEEKFVILCKARSIKDIAKRCRIEIS